MDIQQKLDQIFTVPEFYNISFSDGIANAFSCQLLALMQVFGIPAIETLHRSINEHRYNPVDISEALRWLPQVDNEQTHSSLMMLGCSNRVLRRWNIRSFIVLAWRVPEDMGVGNSPGRGGIKSIL